MNLASIDRPNAVCGAFFIIVGAIFAAQSLAVELGTWLRIGPGGLPLVLVAAADSARRDHPHSGDPLAKANRVGAHRLARHRFHPAGADPLRPYGARRWALSAAVFITALVASLCLLQDDAALRARAVGVLTIFSTRCSAMGSACRSSGSVPGCGFRRRPWNFSTISRSASPPPRPSPISASA